MLQATRKVLSVVALTAVFLLTACGGSAPEAKNVPAPAAPATEAPSAESPVQEAAPTNSPTEAAASASGGVSFSKDVLPVLQSRCINCHGGQRTNEGLDIKTYEALMAGSENGQVVIPGDAANSSFVTLAAEGKMPKRGPKLTPAEVQLLTDWVNAGAPSN